jgi:hypothetical protein
MDVRYGQQVPLLVWKSPELSFAKSIIWYDSANLFSPQDGLETA